ncbi:hypothetical protein HCN44_000540 [Aphidius gifuensis]|uniref:Odorant-binding protein n=1 Tax=Aphidius gifuensis TaxID=684658 RepID=A0A3Q9EL79_APHGI|nr:general odorant-binding protein 56d-like [Aphidius gifuensis]AZQ25004.1 odorant-binding protein [Aphidius gifuensis]KAF7990735.1 hypothetical protein HCN44_000540 [Aphidius gifuensis]
MKFIFLFLTFAILAYNVKAQTAAGLIRLQAANRLCRQQNGIDRSLINRARQGEFIDNNPQFDCYVGCLLQQLGLTYDDGSLDVNTAVNMVPLTSPSHDQIVNAISICGNQRGNDKCSTAHLLYSCMYQNNIPVQALG